MSVDKVLAIFVKNGVNFSDYAANELSVKRRLPLNFEERDMRLFVNDLEAAMPSPTVACLSDIRVLSSGLLLHNDRILLESFSNPENYRNWKARSVLKAHVENRLVGRVRKEKQVLWPVDDWSDGYFHWITDVLPKLLIGSDLSAPVLLPVRFKKYKFVEPSLRLLGVNEFRYMERREIALCERLYLPLLTYFAHDFNEETMKELRRRMRGVHYNDLDRSNGRIYISRRKANKRRILNENDIFPILKKFGFEIVDAEDLTFLEQLNQFSQTTHLISIHGAGLTNMLFMQPGSRVLEIRKNDPRVTNCFFNMASALDLDYFYQTCQARDSHIAPHTADLMVDIDEFEVNVTRFIQH